MGVEDVAEVTDFRSDQFVIKIQPDFMKRWREQEDDDYPRRRFQHVERLDRLEEKDYSPRLLSDEASRKFRIWYWLRTLKETAKMAKAATSTPFAGRDPADAANAARCPVHKVRMSYHPGDNSWFCKQTDQATGNQCSARAYPNVENLDLLKNKKYTGPVKILAAFKQVPEGGDSADIYLLLTDLGVAVNVTQYIDLTQEEAVQVADDQSCKLSLAFDRIDFAQPPTANAG